MLPFDYVQKFMVNMPRVVADQKVKFESDDLFKKLSRESEVIYFFNLIFLLRFSEYKVHTSIFALNSKGMSYS